MLRVDEGLVVAANEPAPLDDVPHHRTPGAALLRRAPTGIPLHVATHETVGLVAAPARYVEPHAHPAEEVNVLVGAPGALRYRFDVGGEVSEVSSPAVVRLPAGVPHAATVLDGTGTYVCVIATSTEDAFSGAPPAACHPTHVAVHDLSKGEVRGRGAAVVVLVPDPGQAADVLVEADDLEQPTVVVAPATLRLPDGVWRLRAAGPGPVHAVSVSPSP